MLLPQGEIDDNPLRDDGMGKWDVGKVASVVPGSRELYSLLRKA